ncbi:hypothetical protein HY024_05340, partial [Candidatus Curtissbacteria bacterium]|nr:hypothetical protein [Candidatus Curtissbacteria bacterium]
MAERPVPGAKLNPERVLTSAERLRVSIIDAFGQLAQRRTPTIVGEGYVVYQGTMINADGLEVPDPHNFVACQGLETHRPLVSVKRTVAPGKYVGRRVLISVGREAGEDPKVEPREKPTVEYNAWDCQFVRKGHNIKWIYRYKDDKPTIDSRGAMIGAARIVSDVTSFAVTWGITG